MNAPCPPALALAAGLAPLAQTAMACTITQAEFGAIVPGTPLAEAERIVGCEGGVAFERDAGNGQNVATIVWDGNGPPGSHASLTFVDDVYISGLPANLQ